MISGIAIAALTIFVYMVIIYFIARIVKNYAVVDIAWGPGFIITTIILASTSHNPHDGPLILSTLVILWGFRLAGHIYLRNAGRPEDFRYAKWRKQWGRNESVKSFLKIFMLQGLLMLVVSLPVIRSFTGAREYPGLVNYIGIIVFSAGFLIETVADWQLSEFQKQNRHSGKFLTSGLWKYSRHPNYLGESIVWWGLWLLSAGNGLWYITLSSPLLITILVRFVSGVPLLEARFRNRPEFKEYARNTPVFIPFIGKKGQ